MVTLASVMRYYEALKTEARIDLQNNNVIELIETLYDSCASYLSTVERIDLISRVEGKTYFAFKVGDKYSRAVNRQLFDSEYLPSTLLEAVKIGSIERLTPAQITQTCYLLVMTFCCVIDIFKKGDQKTPGTYFEHFVGGLYARTFQTNPSTRIELELSDSNASDTVTLQTDYIFDLGENRPKYYIPIKTSTRERASEVWIHQTILDQAFGPGAYVGLLTCLAETKLDHRNYEVVEICVPNQWRAYQRYAARIARAYYLDPPNIYLQLSEKSSGLVVKPFGEFFKEPFLKD